MEERVIYKDGTNQDFAELTQLLDEEFSETFGKDQRKFAPYNTLTELKHVIVIFDGNEPVACGSFKAYSEQVAEVKRIFVKKSYRKQGLAKKLMKLLEEKGRAAGYKKLILETNRSLIPAVTLYHGMGYEAIPNYGPYENIETSICMEKVIEY